MGKVVKVKEKAVAIEKKHSVILNALVIACALVVIFVALFAPLKVVTYGIVYPDTEMSGPIYDDYDIEGKPGDENFAVTTTVHYVEVKQSIWQVIGALSYVVFDTYNETGEGMDDSINLHKAVTEFRQSKEYAEIYKKMIEAEAKQDSDAMLEAQNEMVEEFADYLSDINILGYALAKNFTVIMNTIDEAGDLVDNLSSGYDDGYDDDYDDGNHFQDDIDDILDKVDAVVLASMTYVDAVYTLVFAAVIVVLAIVAAIVSLVFLIKAILGIVKKQPQQKLFKYLAIMLGLSGTAVLLSMFAPLLSVGGGMFAIALFVSITYFLCGLCKSLLFDKDGVVLTAKRAGIALFGMIAFFLLCTRIYSLKTVTENVRTDVVNGAMGFGWVNLFNIMTKIDLLSSIEGGIGHTVGVILFDSIVPGVVGFISYIILFFAMIFALRAYQRTLFCLAHGDVKKSSCNGFAITAAVFMLIAIIVNMIMPGIIADVFIEMFKETIALSADELTASWTIRAQVWVSMIFFLAIAIVNIAYKPKSKNIQQPEAETQIESQPEAQTEQE